MIPGWVETVKGAVSGIFGSEGISGLIDNITTNKEEKGEIKAKLDTIKNNFETKMVELALEQEKLQAEREKAFLLDTQDARQNAARIQESDKASWLSKNVAYCIDIFLTVLWGLVTVILFLKIFKIAASDVDMVSLMALHGTVTAVFMTVVNFHRGTSRGSEDKQKHLNKMMEK